MKVFREKFLSKGNLSKMRKGIIGAIFGRIRIEIFSRNSLGIAEGISRGFFKIFQNKTSLGHHLRIPAGVPPKIHARISSGFRSGIYQESHVEVLQEIHYMISSDIISKAFLK